MNTNINLKDYSNQIIKEHNEIHFHNQRTAVMNNKTLPNAKSIIILDSPAKRKITFSETERQQPDPVHKRIKKLRRHSENYLASLSSVTKDHILKPIPRRLKKITHIPITKDIIINKPLKDPTQIEQSIYRGSFTPVTPIRSILPKPRYFCNEMISLKDNTIIKQAIIQTQMPITITQLCQLQATQRQQLISDLYNGKSYHGLIQREVTDEIFQEYTKGIPNPEPTLEQEKGIVDNHLNQSTRIDFQSPTHNLSVLADAISQLPYQ